MAKTRKNTYLTSDEIYEEWKKWKETGVISERMGKQMLTLAYKVMTSHRFRGYSKEIQEDMVSDGVMKIIQNLHNMKEEYKSSFFSYWTNCVWTSCITYLSKHYRNQNLKKKLLIEAIQDIQEECPTEGGNSLLKQLQDELEKYERKDNEEIV